MAHGNKRSKIVADFILANSGGLKIARRPVFTSYGAAHFGALIVDRRSMPTRSSLRRRLSSRRVLLGFVQTQPNLVLSEMAGMCGYDFVMLDGEHGVFSEQDYLHTLQVVAATTALSFVRTAGHDLQAVGRYLDMGADAIIVPNVSTVDEARSLAGAMEYPPKGTRGFGAPAHRTTRYGMDLDTHMKEPRSVASLLLMIESTVGVSNAEEILGTDGVDGVIVGPSDLSAAVGRLGDFSNPVFKAALACVERAAIKTGKILGTAPHPESSAEALRARGHQILIIGADMPLICAAMRKQVEEAQSYLQSEPPPDKST